ncbi:MULTISPECIES: SprT family zinc-dependent metalloprotease [Rhodopseudomonas]|uniref:Metal-dependent hydrolase n=1 Tax=Rhodopseudomonas palustris TaxID=1076 RepID=A0A0D7EXJ4_RHOPL|nr:MULTISPECIES: SprT family zinc-dependent metalloprotease [Rhodopseudomonas]KIZ45579.1 metal-dependent hydrolase [Rhodopseudomonas palustris]MDF3809000.1 SprT family zinc-dependent metalloprotease [Rhodopseudomonas sp. BAL398]WOK16854.1 SprT family zinc-dependent metalloprotease [Rhodopseudomonas sp. BAL398]
MICFCAERFPWRRIWQNPGSFLMSGSPDMAFRALLYRRPTEPQTLAVKFGSQIFAIRLRRHRRARRYTLRIHPSDREAILTMPPRGTLADAKEFAQRHGAWIAARLGRLPKAAPFHPGTLVPLRGHDHKIVHRAGVRGTVWTEIRDSGERIICVAGEAEHIDRRVHDFLKREARKDLQKASQHYAEALGVKVTRISIRDQSSRWGSCTSAGSLSFSWRLILSPPYVLDYLAAHEVAHLVEMNHSARFWKVVAKVCPSVERAKTWLDTHGNDLHRYGISD